MIRNERLTATLDGKFVVFLIGMPINQPSSHSQVDPGRLCDAQNAQGTLPTSRVGIFTRGDVVFQNDNISAILALAGAAIGLCEEQKRRAFACVEGQRGGADIKSGR